VKRLNTGGTANEFHVWQRRALSACVIQDLDAWAIVASDFDYAPLALFELKRSHRSPLTWRPYPDDRRNYAALHALAERADIPFYVVYWQKGYEIDDDTMFSVFQFDQVVPEYHGRMIYLPASDFARKFPYPLRPRVNA
jgi:hypothetical protein